MENRKSAKSKGNDAKRQKISHDENIIINKVNPAYRKVSGYNKSSGKEQYCHPFSIVTWNCNGFTTRAQYDQDKLHKLACQNIPVPDMICIQEARVRPAINNRGRPRTDMDSKHIQKALEGPLHRYIPFWSLADKKYAGTLTLLRWRLLEDYGYENPKRKNKPSEGRYDPDLVAFTPSTAIDLMLRRLGLTRKECGLKELPPKAPQKKQTSLKSFFAPKKKKSAPEEEPKHQHLEHHSEGRFQFFFFPGMDLVQTYVPNNGLKEESFERRRHWDETMLQFVKERKQIMKALSSRKTKGANKTSKNNNHYNNKDWDDVYSCPDRKLLWCGDMNVAATYMDGSHWEKRQPKPNESSTNGDELYEWFRDESKFLSRAEKEANSPKKLPENVGIPGFTPAERERFAKFLEEGDFCDVWRDLHPQGEVPQFLDGESNPWELANFTWRGAKAKRGGYARFEGKGQRIDYFLISPKNRVEEVLLCKIRGHGTNREDLFCGSDHCAVQLLFNP